jgi:hypothetical protein
VDLDELASMLELNSNEVTSLAYYSPVECVDLL